MVAKGFQLAVLAVTGLFIAGCSTLPADSRSADEAKPPMAVTTKPIEQADPGYEASEQTPVTPEDASSSAQPKSAKSLVVEQLQREALQSQAEGNWAESELKLERAPAYSRG